MYKSPPQEPQFSECGISGVAARVYLVRFVVPSGQPFLAYPKRDCHFRPAADTTRSRVNKEVAHDIVEYREGRRQLSLPRSKRCCI